MPPPEGGICRRLTQYLPLGCLQGGCVVKLRNDVLDTIRATPLPIYDTNQHFLDTGSAFALTISCGNT